MFKVKPFTQAMYDQCKALDDIKVGKTCKSNIPADPSWQGNQRKYKAHCKGNLYALTVQNRTMNHVFTVHQYGKNVWQAGLRYYKGLNGKGGNWVWTCTKIVKAKKIS